MSPFPHVQLRVWRRRAIYARVWTSSGSRLPNDASAPQNFSVDHPRLSTGVEPSIGSTLPFLSQLLLLRAYRDRTLRSLAWCLARAASAPTLSPFRRGRL